MDELTIMIQSRTGEETYLYITYGVELDAEMIVEARIGIASRIMADANKHHTDDELTLSHDNS